MNIYSNFVKESYVEHGLKVFLNADTSFKLLIQVQYNKMLYVQFLFILIYSRKSQYCSVRQHKRCVTSIVFLNEIKSGHSCVKVNKGDLLLQKCSLYGVIVVCTVGAHCVGRGGVCACWYFVVCVGECD